MIATALHSKNCLHLSSHALLLAVVIALLSFTATASGHNYPFIDQENNIIRLTHVPCQIIEAENNTDHGFDVWHESHCRRINLKTGKDRLEQAGIPTISEGEWTFIVRNRNVAWKVGFWLRAEQVAERLSLPKAELSGYLDAGQEGRVTITLKAGQYIYSCPYNPTLTYRLAVVEN